MDLEKIFLEANRTILLDFIHFFPGLLTEEQLIRGLQALGVTGEEESFSFPRDYGLQESRKLLFHSDFEFRFADP